MSQPSTKQKFFNTKESIKELVKSFTPEQIAAQEELFKAHEAHQKCIKEHEERQKHILRNPGTYSRDPVLRHEIDRVTGYKLVYFDYSHCRPPEDDMTALSEEIDKSIIRDRHCHERKESTTPQSSTNTTGIDPVVHRSFSITADGRSVVNEYRGSFCFGGPK